MTTGHFFDEQTEQSLVKSTIVSKYFDVWASVITQTQGKTKNFTKKIAYIDLFAGPGRYRDGTISTPVMIIQKAIEKYNRNLVCLFNDKDDNNANTLKNVINNIAGIEKLIYKPQVYSHEVGTEIVEMFESLNLIPTLFFVDPWGYKGLSLKLINSVIKNWGCDCIFFLNYNRINMGISNLSVKLHMDALFGEDRAEKVREKLLQCSTPENREFMIIEELCAALKDLGGKFTLPFRFRSPQGKRTSHHLIFVSKAFKGYEIMKDIMAKESSSSDEGVPSFEYNPIDRTKITQGLLFKLTTPIKNLGTELLNEFNGKSISMYDIYRNHSIDTPFIKKNYKDALLLLEKEGKITATRGHRQKSNAFADSVIAHFPTR